VRGASGSGKTVALRAWVEEATARTFWITVTPEISASADFAESAMSLLRRSGADVPTQPAGDPWERPRAAAAGIGEPLVLIVDDAAIAQERTLEDMCRLVTSVANLRLIAAENRRTELDRPGLGLLVDRTEIGPRELMLDDDEIRRLLDVDAAVAAEVREATGGFPAIVHAIAQQGPDVGGAAALRAAFDAVTDFFACAWTRSGRNGMSRTLFST